MDQRRKGKRLRGKQQEDNKKRSQKRACEKCSTIFESRCDLRKHRKKNRCVVDVAATKNIKIGQDALPTCMHCSQAWNNLDMCSKHVKVCSARVKGDGKSSFSKKKKSIGYSCNYCGKIYNYIKPFFGHISTCMSQAKKVKACGFQTTKNVSNTKSSVTTIPQHSRASRKNQCKYSCIKCHQTFRNNFCGVVLRFN